MTDYTNAPAIPPVVGKQYVMRNGEVTGVIVNTGALAYPMDDGDTSWTINGFHLNGNAWHGKDIVAEYTADTPNSPADGKVTQSAPHDTKTAAWAIMGGYMKRVMKHVEQDDLAHAAQEWRSMVAFAQEAGL